MAKKNETTIGRHFLIRRFNTRPKKEQTLKWIIVTVPGYYNEFLF
jgi:hypothetical protein